MLYFTFDFFLHYKSTSNVSIFQLKRHSKMRAPTKYRISKNESAEAPITSPSQPPIFAVKNRNIPLTFCVSKLITKIGNFYWTSFTYYMNAKKI